MSRPLLISGPEIPRLLPMHEDSRREIREAEIRMPDGSIRRVTHLAIKGAGVLGQHYHPIPEYFTVRAGNPDIVTAPHDKLADVQVRRPPACGHVIMAPGEVHAFQFGEGGGYLISTMDGAFDPAQLIPATLDVPARHDD